MFAAVAILATLATSAVAILPLSSGQSVVTYSQGVSAIPDVVGRRNYQYNGPWTGSGPYPGYGVNWRPVNTNYGSSGPYNYNGVNGLNRWNNWNNAQGYGRNNWNGNNWNGNNWNGNNWNNGNNWTNGNNVYGYGWNNAYVNGWNSLPYTYVNGWNSLPYTYVNSWNSLPSTYVNGWKSLPSTYGNGWNNIPYNWVNGWSGVGDIDRGWIADVYDPTLLVNSFVSYRGANPFRYGRYGYGIAARV